MKNIFLLLIVVTYSGSSLAGYDANMSGEIEGIYAYAGTDAIYIKLVNQPSSHTTCNPTHFVIDSSVPESRRQMMFSRFLAAYASKESVNIGFDSKGDCADGYIRVHRAG